ncbi:FAD dependent oxidoreductase domain containing 2, partial [Chelydra serpentina]
ETAENILGVTNFIHMVSRSRVRLSWATHYVGDLRAINNGLLDTYQLKSLDGLLEGDLEDLAIVKDKKGKLHITLKFYLENSNSSAGAESITLPQDELDNFVSGADKDVFYYNRAVGEAQHAWQSNFLHPLIYYYKRLPTEREMRLRPPDWPLPRPDAVHHIVEDFLTDWTAPNAHILPLRRFLENCLDTDLAASLKSPVSCLL